MRSSLDRNIAGVDDAIDRRRQHRSLAIARGRDLAGVIGAWRTHMGAPGNLGGLVVFTRNAGRTPR